MTAELAARVRILADDVTGACDSGAAFLAAGHSVRVWFGATPLFPAPETVQAFHTASRYLAAGGAAEVVARAAAGLERDGRTILFKKVDSAGRGLIAAEVLAAHRALGSKAILFAPGFPAAGRTVRDGILEIRDACGQNTQVSLPELFAPEMSEGIALVKTAAEVARAIECGKTLLMCDSATQDELNALARAAEPLHELLYAGSAGLAQAIASLHPAPAPDAPAAAARRTLVIAGTPHPITRLQLESLESATRERQDARILRIACEDGDEAKICSAFEAFEPDALILTGGDTAQMAADALGVHSILLRGEFAPGIPWGRLEGGAAQGRIAVTKSGGFGSAGTLNEIVERLSGAA
ncbi:MAG: four-carbon acid sugar kinase family protein [Terracidiphilus sp.]